MRSRSPVSTISYNSIDFLFSKLEELRENHDISFWSFVYHFRELDENKDHIHLFIKPNHILDTMDIQQFLLEPDLQNPDLPPLGCRDFRFSVCDSMGYPDEWILYNSHYPPYLASKNQSRAFTYQMHDFYASDYDEFEDCWRHAMNGSTWAQRNQLLNILSDRRVNPASLIENGSLPLNMACQVNAYETYISFK